MRFTLNTFFPARKPYEAKSAGFFKKIFLAKVTLHCAEELFYFETPICVRNSLVTQLNGLVGCLNVLLCRFLSCCKKYYGEAPISVRNSLVTQTG